MKICKLTTYNPAAGDILILEDSGGPEGIWLRSQHKRVEDAVAALAGCYSERIAVVRLVNLDITELQQELPL